MTHDRAAFLAFNRAVRRAADDYYARPNAFAEPTHCDAGHLFNPEPRPRPGRAPRCRTCQADRSREYRARKKDAA